MPSGRIGRVPTTFSLFVSVFTSGSPHFSRGVEHRIDDLVITGTAAEIAREPVAHFFFRRIGIALEQRTRGDEYSGRAVAALQCRVLEEFSLQRMELGAGGHAFDGLDRFAFSFDAQHEARAGETSVYRHAARAAVAGAAAFLSTGETELVAQHIEQALLRFAEKL